MDGVDRAARRRSLKERLGLNGIAGCCGATWGLAARDDDVVGAAGPPSSQMETRPTSPCVGQSPASSGMNLAAALAAERQVRAALDSENGVAGVGSSPTIRGTAGTAPGTPARVSLMRLLEETDGYDGDIKKEEGGAGCDSVCCVCMGRKKGAAFIPCGHSFCRVCSRELWVNRGSCPLCNRPIIEILDIY